MDVINKLYSSVSSTVSQLSGVLPGNPVTREFEASQLIASAGPGLLWKIYKGYKKSTRQEASIFVFEKRCLDRWSKADRELMLETVRRGVSQLTKLRHPQILTVQHGLEESRESLAFAAEPVLASLANVLTSSETTSTPTPALYELEIKYGLTQLAEGLAFLHNDVKLLHRNLCPESIVVNQQGAWKIFGFDFCVANQAKSGEEPYWPFIEYCRAMHPLTQPSLEYLAPEVALAAIYSPASDLFSLGALIYSLHSRDHRPLAAISGDYDAWRRHANDLRRLSADRISCVPDGLRDSVKLMLNTTPELRPDPHQFIKIPYFEDVGVKTLNYLDSMFQWDNLQKSQFYKGLPQVIQKMPHRICLYRILPCLAKEFVNPPMVPFVLPNVLLIAENSSKEEYVKHIFPILKPVMAIQDPVQILLIFMQKMELLLKLTPGEEIKSDVLPMLYRALESDAQQIQELCLSVLPTFASLIDYPAMKNALLPRIKKLCLTTNYISVRVNCLLCLGKLLEHLDKWLVLDEVIPFLPQIPSREPAVIMGILGIYKLAMSHKKLGITKEVTARKVLPFLMPLCVETGLSVAQYNSLVGLVRQLLDQVESEHRATLKQLNSIQSEAKKMEQTLASCGDNLVAAPPPQTDIDKMFGGLGLDKFTLATNNDVTPATIPDSSGGGGNSLSMEDKQRIAQQQEAAHRLSRQPAPRPSVPLKEKPVSRPVDLTNSLLQSNLNQITSTKQMSTQLRPENPNNLQHQPPVNNLSNWNSKPALPPNTGWSPNNSVTPKQWPAHNQTNKQDWSAFDSLLPSNNVSTNQINSPLMGQGANNNPNHIKQLSKSDIMDLLG